MFVLSAAGACTGELEDNELDPFLCTSDDLGGGDYQELVRGDFSPRDLADLGPDSDDRQREFRQAGMERGRFVFWKQALPRPPFDPPINVVCQVLEFESADDAREWVEGLEAEDSLATTAIAWIPEEGREFEEVELIDYPPPKVRYRTFEIRAGADPSAVAATFRSWNLGRLVVTFGVGRAAETVTEADRTEMNRFLERWSFRSKDIAVPR